MKIFNGGHPADVLTLARRFCRLVAKLLPIARFVDQIWSRIVAARIGAEVAVTPF